MDDEPAADRDRELDGPDPIETVDFEVTDVLDLHAFRPSEVGDLVRDYLDLACERGLTKLRIVHGKGVGVQRERVHKILAADPRVLTFGQPPGEAGGWGATWVELRPDGRRAPDG